MNDTSRRAEARHKFDCPMSPPIGRRELYRRRFATHFIPYLRILEQTIGREAVLASLRELAAHGAKEYAESVIQSAGKNDLSVFKSIFDPANPDLGQVVSLEVLESTDAIYRFRITECLWAQVFRDADAADYGLAAICSDELVTQFINPGIGLELDGTLMEGRPCCQYRFFVRS